MKVHSLGFVALAGMVFLFQAGSSIGADADMSSSPPRLRISEAAAKLLAREAVARVILVPSNVEITVCQQPKSPGDAYRMQFEMPLPEGAFALEDRPFVEVSSSDGKVWCSVWRDDMDGAQMAHPEVIERRFMVGKGKDPERALRLARKWMDGHRQSSEYDTHQDYAYGVLARVVRASSHPEKLEEILRDELARKPGAWAQYAIRHELSTLLTGQKRYEEALEQMRLARAALKDETGSILTTRYTMTLLEMGRIYRASGERRKAAGILETYLSTSDGTNNCFTIGKELGDLYEQDQAWQKARALYNRVIAIPFPHAASPVYIESCRDEMRERLRLLDVLEAAARDVAPNAAPTPGKE